MAFWWACDLTGLCEDDEVVEPIGVELLQVVGIGTLADEGLLDGLYPRGRIIVSPDVGDRYDCVGREPLRDPCALEAVELALPTDSAPQLRALLARPARRRHGIPAALMTFDAATRAANVRWLDEYGEDGP